MSNEQKQPPSEFEKSITADLALLALRDNKSGVQVSILIPKILEPGRKETIKLEMQEYFHRLLHIVGMQ